MVGVSKNSAVPMAVMALGLTMASPAFAQLISLAPNETLLEVATSGEVETPPDRGTITAGMMTTGTTPQTAIDANSQAMTRMIAEIKKAGVEVHNLQTSQVNLEPQMNYSNQGEPPRIIGYIARNSVTITLKDPAKAADILTAAFNGGANSAYGPNFSLSNNAAAIDGARARAVANAKAQADVYARAMGMRVSRVLRVSERGQSQNYEAVVVTGSRVGGAPPPPPPPPPVAETPVQIGQIRQSVNLWIDFAMVPN